MSDGSRVDVYDTTLRDGTQREGISLSVDDKLRIAHRLDALGVAFIEGGWPASNPKDVEFFTRAARQSWSRAAICAFGSTRRAGGTAETDAGLAALLEAETPVCTIFGKTWLLHVTDVLRTTGAENLRMIEDSVAFLRSRGRRVIYDAEHFFDGFAADPAYALATLKAAQAGGADVLALCDTNGGSLPWRVGEVVGEVRDAVPGVMLGVHTHNDGELAVANALSAVRAGARHVQGTINGYGERCGNANLCSIVPDLELKMGMRCLPAGALPQLTEVSRFVAGVANLAQDSCLPYVGHSAFAHKGGVHVAAMRRSEASYQHVDPSLVGNRSRVVVSELSGRGNLIAKAEEHGIAVDEDVPAAVVEEIKRNEARGLSYEAAEASVTLLLRRRSPSYRPPFKLVEYRVLARERGDGDSDHEATVKVLVGDDVVHAAAAGNGPVAALDAALRKALVPTYPALARIALVDYKVRIIDGRCGTAAVTRVLIDSSDGSRRWSTVGAAPSILQASWQALADGVEFGLTNGLSNATEDRSVMHESDDRPPAR